MKKILTLLLLTIGFGASAQNLGIGTATPNATLDVLGDPTTVNTPDGILLPRLTLTQLTAKTGYGADQTGAVVYVTDITGTSNSITNVITKVGYYVFNGNKWVPILPKLIGFEAASNVYDNVAAGESKLLNYIIKNYDTNNWFDLATGVFTPKIAGYYDVTLISRVYSNASVKRNVQLFKNGTVIASGFTMVSNMYNSRLNTVVYMNGTTDYLDSRLYSSTAINIGPTSSIHNIFQAHLIGQ